MGAVPQDRQTPAAERAPVGLDPPASEAPNRHARRQIGREGETAEAYVAEGPVVGPALDDEPLGSAVSGVPAAGDSTYCRLDVENVLGAARRAVARGGPLRQALGGVLPDAAAAAPP
jgi:hypothetical protein